MGEQNARGFVALYMVPGVEHCSQVPDRTLLGNSEPPAKGPEHGIYDALEGWVEGGTVPGPIVATKYVDDDRAKGVRMTRPLCPYPQVAKYAGTGDVKVTGHVCHRNN